MKQLHLYNSLTKTLAPFEAIAPPIVGLYTCGPTVYDYPHIGHGRKYVMDDVLKHALQAVGYKVNHVQNVTDVGHLESDSDEGEDKLEKGAKREGKTVWDIAKYYEAEFNKDMDLLGITRPDIVCKATDHIAEQIALISTLIEKDYAYETDEAVYFDVSKLKNYGILSGQKLDEKQVAVRQDVKTGKHKRHPADFSLWFKCVDRFKDHAMQWKSPWGVGFPGWHVECSAMSMKYLGDTIDIHTGGIDHIPVHHPNEIAQSESASGKQFVRYWLHHAFLKVDGEKMSKSKKNFYRVDDVIKKGYDPMDLRYLYLTTHYRKTLNFTWKGLDAARTARLKIDSQVSRLKGADQEVKRTVLSKEKLGKVDAFRKRFESAIANDLNTPQGLAVVWEVLKSNIPPEDKYDLIMSFDEVLGLRLGKKTEVRDSSGEGVPDNIQKLVDLRNSFRADQKWDEADRVRGEIESKGYEIEDGPEGTIIKPIAATA